MPASSYRYFVWLAVVSVAMAVYVYFPAGLYFLADDFIHVPESAKQVWEQRNALRPVGNITLHIDHWLSGKSALGYHISSLLFHLVNGLLVFVVARLLYQRYTDIKQPVIPALVSASLFILYPFHCETVYWIIGRTGSLGAMLLLPAFYCFIKRNDGVKYYISSLVFFELALLSYESTWIFPLLSIIIVVADNRLQSTTFRKACLHVGGIVLVFVLHLLLRYRVTHELVNHYDAASLLQGQLLQVMLNYARLFIRSMLPPFAQVSHLLIGFAIVFLLLALLVKQYFKQKPQPLFYILSAAWLFSYSPYGSLGIDTHGVEGGRYLYLPAAFFIIWLVHVLYRVGAGARWLAGFIPVLVIGFFLMLLQARSYYHKASRITHTTIQAIQFLPTKEKVYIQQLPQYHKGAVIFRLGLQEGVNWLVPGAADKLIILSIDSSDVQVNANPSRSFTTSYRVANLKPAFTYCMVNDHTHQKNLIPKDTSLHFDPAKDALLTFINDTLWVETR